jgi:hypothetical protein
MPTAAPSSSPIVPSRGDSGEIIKNFQQPIQNVSLLTPPMMSRMSAYQHVALLNMLLW